MAGEMLKQGLWMQEAFKNAHGQLRKKMHAKAGKPMTMEMLMEAKKRGGKTAKQANLALIARRANRG